MYERPFRRRRASKRHLLVDRRGVINTSICASSANAARRLDQVGDDPILARAGMNRENTAYGADARPVPRPRGDEPLAMNSKVASADVWKTGRRSRSVVRSPPQGVHPIAERGGGQDLVGAEYEGVHA